MVTLRSYHRSGSGAVHGYRSLRYDGAVGQRLLLNRY
jgi:hypothetical protein